jgi:hypothetical protein
VSQTSLGLHVRRGRDYGLGLSRVISTCVLKTTFSPKHTTCRLALDVPMGPIRNFVSWISVPLTDAALVHLVSGAVRELESESEGAGRGARRTTRGARMDNEGSQNQTASSTRKRPTSWNEDNRLGSPKRNKSTSILDNKAEPRRAPSCRGTAAWKGLSPVWDLPWRSKCSASKNGFCSLITE